MSTCVSSPMTNHHATGTWAGSVRRFSSGASATSPAMNWRAGPNAICMTLACRGAISPTRSISRSGGLDEPPRRHRSATRMPAVPSYEAARLERAMLKLNLADLGQYSDVVHTPRRSGRHCASSTPGDAEELQAYVRGLSSASRYKRFLGAMSELPATVLDDFIHTGRRRSFQPRREHVRRRCRAHRRRGAICVSSRE